MANAATLKHPKQQTPLPAPADTAAAPSHVAFAMLSNPGRLRPANEDACAALPERAAFIVCDGMGGAASGEVASHLASEAFLHALSRPVPSHPRRIPPKSASDVSNIQDRAQDPVQHPAPRYPPSHPHTRLTEAIRAANQAVFRQSRKTPRLHGMGTTLVAALIQSAGSSAEDAAHPRNGHRAAPARTLWLVHVGDSRCYRLRRGVLHQLTHDHSLVEEQVSAGLLTRVQAAASPFRNIITRAIGTQASVEPEISAHDLQPGDLYLLASDGLTRELDDTAIAAVLTQTLGRTLAHHAAAHLEDACHALIDAANAHGGRDNITALLIACP